MSIIKHFSKNILTTEIGELIYAGDIGEGGNAKVLAFKKGDLPYAVKFLPHDRAGSLARFKDEFFCAAQIPSHPNIARSFHLDRTQIEGKNYSLIIMKRYQKNLSAIGSISTEDDDIKGARGWELLEALCAGIEHLHNHGIIHRDLKPQNIFFDQQENTFVIGDLGIAHFSDELYAREAATKDIERLANFSCCAPEQVTPGTPAAPTMDIFALGQILHWYIYESFVRGGGRPVYAGQNKQLELLDKIIDLCIKNSPNQRPKDVRSIREFIEESKNPPKDAWKPIRDLDNAFRASIPRIPELYETDDQAIINRFLSNFSNQCDPSRYWYVLSNGGDNVLEAISKMPTGHWLLHHTYECIVEKLICYKYPGEWQSFFTLLLEADTPFEVTDMNGRKAARKIVSSYDQDAAAFYENRYIEMEDFDNGYLLHDDEMIRINLPEAQSRRRFLNRAALMIVPESSGIVRASDREPNTNFLKRIIDTGSTGKRDIRSLIDATVKFTDREIINRL